MEVKIEQAVKVLGGKEYQVTITRKKGLHEVVIDGKPTLIEAATYIEWPGNMGTTKNYTMPRPKKTPEEEAAFLRNVQEIATRGLINLGVW